MLKNELKKIEALLRDVDGGFDIDHSATDLHRQVQRVQDAWLNVVFSELPKSRLERYLQFHLEGISKISDTLNELRIDYRDNFQNGLLSLIDHLDQFYHQLINWDTRAPEAYRKRIIDKLKPDLNKIRSVLKRPEIDILLSESISLWIDEITNDQNKFHFTFRSLIYVGKLVSGLVNLDWEGSGLSASIACLLYQSNFNHLAFLKYLQDEIINTTKHLPDVNASLNHFQSRLAEFMAMPLECNAAYDPSWPSIKTMVTDWLKEQVSLAEIEKNKEFEKNHVLLDCKLALNLSVAHMACMIKLFYEAEVFGTENLRSVFKFYAANYESKRQPSISWESLSKEYYSLNTNTAKRIKKILQRMIDNLNRGFFPVSAVVSVALGIYSGNQ